MLCVSLSNCRNVYMQVTVSRHRVSREVSSISITDPSNLISLDAFQRGHRRSAWNLSINEVTCQTKIG